MSWVECKTEEELIKWNLIADTILNEACKISVEDHLYLIERKSDARFYLYSDIGGDHIAFSIIYKEKLDMYRIYQAVVVDKTYLTEYHVKLKEIMVETEKQMYMPKGYLTHEFVQDIQKEGNADGSTDIIRDKLGIDMEIGEEIIIFKVR